MNSNQVASHYDNHPCSWICYREHPIIRLNSFSSDICPESVSNSLGNEDNFCLPVALWLSDHDFSVLDIYGCQFKNLTNPHPTPCHEFQDEAISQIICPEDYLVYSLLFNDLALEWLRGSENLSQYW